VARSFRRSLTRSPPRQTGWGVGPKSLASGGPGTKFTGTAAVLGNIVSVPASDGITLIRLRGSFMAYLNSAVNLDDGFSGAVGVGIFNDQALTAGIASIQTPITEEGWDGWLWHSYFSLYSADAIATAGVALAPNQSDALKAAIRIDVDSKAMRKVPVGMEIAVVIEAFEVGDAVMSWSFNSRTLAKLP